tara:strand:+ start:711 stop:911 length:201 start_codon:yes stop_codon:yes gene_type:complete
MKLAIVICMALMSFTSSANYEVSIGTIEYCIVNYPGGKKKKNSKTKRANKRRKRICHRAARRNFAG